MRRPRVLIAGGGFAGLACALSLDSRKFTVTLVDRRRCFEFIPNIHELVSGSKSPSQLRLPLGPLLGARGHRFRHGEIEDIDSARRALRLTDGRHFEADFLVLATGSTDAEYGVRGVRRHALPLRSVDDGVRIQRRVSALKRAPDPVRLVVAGAGLAGIEALGEVLRVLPAREHAVHVVEAAPRLLPGAPERVSRYLARHCRRAGVELHLGDPVHSVSAHSVRLASGTRIASDITLWTGGPAPPALLADAHIAGAGEWAAVNADLTLPGHRAVFVAGDSAQLPRPVSRQAYHALDMGSAVAANIGRIVAGGEARRYRPRPRPTLLAFGNAGCVLISGRRAIAAPALAAGKEAVYAAVMAQMDRREPLQRLRHLIRRGRASGERIRPLLHPAELLCGIARSRVL